MIRRIIVDASDKSSCSSIESALQTARQYEGEPVCIHVRPGVYHEKLVIEQPEIILEGECAEKTVLSYDDYAAKKMPDGTAYGTFRTATVRIAADDFTARNITFLNTAGPGPKAGQALALYVDGDRMVFENCRMIGGQDTLFTAPIPPKAVQRGGFKGADEFRPERTGRHYYHRCLISGDVDFIFGSATAYFEDCEIRSNNLGREINGYVTAASTPAGQAFGYVFNQCRFTSDCKEGSVYLGRPWRDYAKVAILRSELGAHIKREGWHDWDRPDTHETVTYVEYDNTGAGADVSNREPWSRQLTEAELPGYSRQAVLGDWLLTRLSEQGRESL